MLCFELKIEGCAAEDWRQHDAVTTAALNVVFPPSTYSTHGLSRPATPNEGHLDRWVIEKDLKVGLVTSILYVSILIF